jgi:Glycosyl hydrolases family 16
MSTFFKSLIPFLLSSPVLGVPQPFNQERAATATTNACNAQTSISSMKSISSSARASPATQSGSSTRSSAAPTSSSTQPFKAGCLWNVPGVGSFTEMSNFKFEGTALPAGLQTNVYPVNDNAPFTHSFTASNAYVDDSFLNLRVLGKQTQSPIKCGEVQTTFKDIQYASVRTLAIFSDVPGTCAGIFFYKNDTQEIDIEYLSDPSSLSNSGANAPIPLLYTNQATVAGGIATHSIGPPPLDVTTLHEYRIDWVSGSTSFYLDGVFQKSFTENVPTQPGAWIFNHWTNGDQGFSVGPPQADSIFKIQNIVMYYNRTSTVGTCGR